MTFTECFKEKGTLESLIDTALPTVVDDVTRVAGPLQADFQLSKEYQGCATIFAVIGVLMLTLPFSELYSELFSFPSLSISIIFISVGLLFFLLSYYNIKQSRKFVNNFLKVSHDVIYRSAMKMLGINDAQRILFTVGKSENSKQIDQATTGILSAFIEAPERTQLLSLLDFSELVTEDRNRVYMGDIVTFTADTKSVCMAELDIQNVTGSGKNKHTKKIFHGYFVSCDISKHRVGKTFISTDGDRDGFGHRTFWNTKVTGSGLSNVTLEWNEFENLLHVASSSQMEAREILVPDFMHRLFVWWKDNQGNIRLSFIGSRLCILFPSATVELNASVTTITALAVKAELLSITQPLVPVLQLIETL